MNTSDARGRAAEVQSAFLEGWRKALGFRSMYPTDREAWMGSIARMRLAYGVFPPCPRCSCQMIDLTSGQPPKCLQCGEQRMMRTDQAISRAPMATERQIRELVTRFTIEHVGDGRDARAAYRDA